MFGLPGPTFAAVFGILGFWALYTIVFYIWSGSAWKEEDRGGGRKF